VECHQWSLSGRGQGHRKEVLAPVSCPSPCHQPRCGSLLAWHPSAVVSPSTLLHADSVSDIIRPAFLVFENVKKKEEKKKGKNCPNPSLEGSTVLVEPGISRIEYCLSSCALTFTSCRRLMAMTSDLDWPDHLSATGWAEAALLTASRWVLQA
jgi:hypothetical protein